MFDLERWGEIFQSIKNNKLRTFLSGITITFAIFLFTVLLGMANGVRSTFSESFQNEAENTIIIYPRKTSKAYKGYQSGRTINLKFEDYKAIVAEHKSDIQYNSPRISKSLQGTYKYKKYNYNVFGVQPDIQFIEEIKISYGRFINSYDFSQKRKVAVIGRMVAEDLFLKGEDPIGKYVDFGGVNYKVIGIFTDKGGDEEERFVYTPISAMEAIYGTDNSIQLFLTYRPELNTTQGIAFGKKLEKDLQKRFFVAPNDQAAFRVNNNAEELQKFESLFLGINFFVFLIGIGTLIAGVIGISNIMIYIVKERTKELGIRKALGAPPRSIVSLILKESIIITCIAGLIGFLSGMGMISLIAKPLEAFMIKGAGVNITIIIIATILVVFAGIVAGYVPAKKASKIKPIVALRED